MKFAKRVEDSNTAKPLPAYLSRASKAASQGKPSKIGSGLSALKEQNPMATQFEQIEQERKYKKNLEALKHEIEERNQEI